MHTDGYHAPIAADAGHAASAEASSCSAARATLAQRILDRRRLLIARIRRRLSGQSAVVIDPDDIFSTTLRRIDVLAAAGRLLDTISDEELVAFATAVAINATHESTRRVRRGIASVQARADGAGRLEGADALTTLARVEGSVELRRRGESLLAALSPVDVEILGLRLRGAGWAAISGELQLTPAAVHRRYFRAVQTLAEVARTSRGALHGTC